MGVVPIVVGAIGALAAPAPDLLVSGDGRHLAVVDADGTPYILRERTGEYMQSLLSEASGFDGAPLLLASRPYAACSRDSCVALVGAAGAQRRLLATRSATRLDWTALTAACSDADIVVSDRRLPRGCMPRWLRLDRATLERTGGVAVYLDRARVDTVGERIGAHPWAM